MITTAPNSLKPLANIITRPVTIFLFAKGSEILKKTFNGEAPRLKAAFSSRNGTASKPSRAALTKKGILTNAMAAAIPKGLPTKSIPTEDAALPAIELRDKKPSKAIPAAECGITIGKSIIPKISFLKIKFLRACKYASGIAPIAINNVAPNEVSKVSLILCITSASFMVANSSGAEVARNIPSKGAMIKIKSNALKTNSINLKLCFIRVYLLQKLLIFLVTNDGFLFQASQLQVDHFSP